MAQLIVIKGPDMGKTFDLGDSNLVGRAPACSVRLSDEQVEPSQARILRVSGELRLQNAGQPQQVKLNGEGVEETRLQHGDLIAVGNSLLLFDDEKDRLQESSANDIVTKDLIDSHIQSRLSYYDSAERVIETFDDLGRSHQRLATLYKIANAIGGILDLEEVLNKVLDVLFEEFKPDRGYILLLDRGNKKLKAMATRFSRAAGDDKAPRVPKSIIKEVFATKDSILSKNAMTDARFMAGESIIGQQIHSAMAVPLVAKGEILGLMHLDCLARSGVFDERDLDHLTKIAMQAAVVIHNAKILRANQEFSRNLLALGEASQRLNSFLRHDLIVRETANSVCRIFGCTKSSVFLVDGAKDELYLAYSIGLEKERWPDARMGLGQGIVGWVAQHCKPLLARSVREVPAEIGFEPKAKYDTTSFLVVPMVSKVEGASEKAAGVICVTDKLNGEPFTRDDQELLGILASHMVNALANARFYQELKEQEEEIQRWNRELEKRVLERTEELQSAQGQLVHSEKMAAIGLLAAGVSHEFNNLITSMYGFAQMAQADSKFRDKLVEIVLSQSQRAKEITESLLSFSKQRGDIFQETSLEEVVDAVLAIVKKALANESIEVVKQFGSVPRTMALPGKLQQVILNLVINARDAIERDGVITIETDHDDANIYLRVRDTGKGIPEENRKRIFEPFFTTKGSFGGSKQPGTGIGLSVCWNIMKEHAGDISVESQVGVGSTFTLRLPVRRDVPRVTGAVERKKTAPIDRLERKQAVLVVDDDEPIREILKNVLSQKNLSVQVVSNAVDALEVCRKQRIDCIFLDLKMPGRMDGFAAFDEIRKLDETIKIILITGRAEDDKLRDYVKRADGYIRKPFKVEEIWELLAV